MIDRPELNWTQDELRIAFLQVLLASSLRDTDRRVTKEMVADILGVSYQEIESTWTWLKHNDLIEFDSIGSIIAEKGVKYLHEQIGDATDHLPLVK
jgi:hypothetical protein